MSKIGKLRRDPALFLRDARSEWLRRLGRLATPLLESEPLRDLLLEPLESIADLPFAGELAKRELARRAQARRQRIAVAGSPQVSIIMAARDAERTIADSIESLTVQSYSNLEIIVIDDGSSDATGELAKAVGGERVKVHRLEESRGAAHARNVGLSLASGELATFNDADDRSHPQRIERQLAAVLESPSAIMSLCSMQREDEGGLPVTINGRRVAKAVITMMFRRAAVIDRIGFLRELHVSEDAEYYERIKAVFGDHAERVLFERLYFARFRPGSLLFADGATDSVGERHIRHRRSAEAEAQWRQILMQIQRIRRGAESPYVARNTR